MLKQLRIYWDHQEEFELGQNGVDFWNTYLKRKWREFVVDSFVAPSRPLLLSMLTCSDLTV